MDLGDLCENGDVFVPMMGGTATKLERKGLAIILVMSTQWLYRGTST